VSRDDIRSVVQIMLRVLARIAKSTRTPADDMLVAMLRGNEARLIDAVTQVAEECKDGAATDEQVAAALKRVGIQVKD
jgi:hypothetical protein